MEFCLVNCVCLEAEQLCEGVLPIADKHRTQNCGLNVRIPVSKLWRELVVVVVHGQLPSCSRKAPLPGYTLRKSSIYILPLVVDCKRPITPLFIPFPSPHPSSPFPRKRSRIQPGDVQNKFTVFFTTYDQMVSIHCHFSS